MSTTRPHGQNYGIFISRRVTATTTAKNGDDKRQLSDDEALCLSTQHIQSPRTTATMTIDFSTIVSGVLAPGHSYMNGLKRQRINFDNLRAHSLRRRNLLIGSLRSQNLAAIKCGLAGDSLGCSSPRPILYELDLNGDETFLIGSLRSQNLATIKCGLAGNSLRCSSPRPILYELDLNSNETF